MNRGWIVGARRVVGCELQYRVTLIASTWKEVAAELKRIKAYGYDAVADPIIACKPSKAQRAA